jgi:hypothetical protein
MPEQQKKGLALIIIIIMLISLVAIGLPFIVSMIFKEKLVRKSFYRGQSVYESRACRNYAITNLYRTHDTYEKKNGQYINAYYDDDVEFKVNLPAINSMVENANPFGKIWGISIQDEQGKIGLKNTPNSVLRNISKILEMKKFLAPDECVTNYAYCTDDWIEPHQLRGHSEVIINDGRMITILHANESLSGRYRREGARVKLTCGANKFFAYVMPSKICPGCNQSFSYTISDHFIHAAPPQGSGESLIKETVSKINWGSSSSAFQGSVILDRSVPPEFITPFTVIEVCQRSSININTACDEVITANLSGIGNRRYEYIWDEQLGEQKKVEIDERITELQAEQLVKRIREKIKQGPLSVELYYKILDDAKNDGIITEKQVANLQENNNGTTEFIDLIEGYFTSTLPFCFRSYDKFRIVSTGIINYPKGSGDEAAKYTQKEIIDITPPGTNKWEIATEYDFFQEFILYGNPSKFVIYPTLYNIGNKQRVFTDTSYSKSGFLQPRSVEDNRGNSIIIANHFSDTHDGKILTGEAFTYSQSQIFRFQNQRDISPGGIEMWVKVNELTEPVYFFDIKQGLNENSLSLYYNGGEIIFSVSDAGLGGNSAQIRSFMNFEPNVWYHLGAYWKGTKYAHLSLFVDGRPVGNFAHYSGANQSVITELIADLTDTISVTVPDGAGLTISVLSNDSFPSSGVLEIGDEAIEYESKTQDGFKVRQVWQKDAQGNPISLLYSGRGSRGTYIEKHPAGAKVTIYGYANILDPVININPNLTSNRLTTGGATYIEPLFDHMPVVNLFKPEVRDAFGLIIQTGGIGAYDTFIPVTPSDTCNINEFPAEGYIIIDNEIISYTGFSKMRVLTSEAAAITVSCFSNCSRGAAGTNAKAHDHMAEIVLNSIKVTDNKNYLDQTIVQIGNEWFGPLQREGLKYFVGAVQAGVGYRIQRGFAWTSVITPTFGAELIPVFAVSSSCCGSGDSITIIEQDQTKIKEEMVINIARRYGDYLVAFTRNVSREYSIDGIVTRLLKFPSDELPSYFPGDFYIAGNGSMQGVTATGFSGLIDEIKIFQNTKGSFKLNTELLSGGNPQVDYIEMNSVSGLSVPGIVKIGDELIGYVSTEQDTGRLVKCKRGYLNTPIQAHSPGERAIHLSFLPVAALSEDILPDAYQIAFTTSFSLSSEGYFLADDEVIGYPWRDNYGVKMPYNRNASGLYRGSFGTTPNFHAKDTILFAIPFRYFDRYKNGAFDTSMSYFKAATKITNARWKKIYWDDEKSSLPASRIKILARFNGGPAWDTIPANNEGGIFEFTDPKGPNILGLIADQIEILSFFEYLPGAYYSNDWKHAPILSGISVEYECPNIIYTHQENK